MPVSARGKIELAPHLFPEKLTAVGGKKHKKVEALVVQFSGGLASGAQDLANYSLVTVPKGKKNSKVVALSQAVYNASAFTVTLTPRKQPVSLRSPLKFTIDAAGLTDAAGQQIDGNDDGQPGGNYVATISKLGTGAVAAARSANPAALAPDAVDALLGASFFLNRHRPRAAVR